MNPNFKRLSPRLASRIAPVALALASTLLLAGWTAPAASAHAAAAKHAAQSAKAQSAYSKQAAATIAADVTASEHSVNALGPAQTATAFLDNSDSFSYSANPSGALAKADVARFTAGLRQAAMLATPALARQYVSGGLSAVPFLEGGDGTFQAVNQKEPWQVAMVGVASGGTVSVLLQAEVVAKTPYRYLTLVHLVHTAGGWRVSNLISPSSPRFEAQLQAWLSSAYTK